MQYDRAKEIISTLTENDYPTDESLPIKCCDEIQANLCLIGRDYEGAVRQSERAITFCEQQALTNTEYYIGAHLLLIMAIHGLVFCDILQQYDRAERAFEQSLQIRKRLYQQHKLYDPLSVPIHSEIAISLVNLGQVAFSRAQECQNSKQRLSCMKRLSTFIVIRSRSTNWREGVPTTSF